MCMHDNKCQYEIMNETINRTKYSRMNHLGKLFGCMMYCSFHFPSIFVQAMFC